MTLLIDISNSFTKLALTDGSTFGERHTVPTRDLNRAALRDLYAGQKFDRVVLSSVVPKHNPLIGETWSVPLVLVDHESPLGVGIDYPDPPTIGADRLANAAAVSALYSCPAIVVDFGTAATFDLISRDKNYVGGVIAPGLDMMGDYLAGKTALLPRLRHWKKVDVLGKSTMHAMQAGAYFGYLGMVREILGELRESVFPDTRPLVIATGGYSSLIADELPEIETTDPDLTLQGLRCIAGRL